MGAVRLGRTGSRLSRRLLRSGRAVGSRRSHRRLGMACSSLSRKARRESSSRLAYARSAQGRDARVAHFSGKATHPISLLLLDVNLGAGLFKLLGLLLQPALDRNHFIHVVLGRVLANLLSDLHRAEVRAAHRTEVRELGSLLWQRFVVILLGKLGIEREIELIFPAKLEASLRQRVVPVLRARMSLRQISRVSRNFVSYHAVLYVLLVRQPEMLL